jgi:hypothetical protein
VAETLASGHARERTAVAGQARVAEDGLMGWVLLIYFGTVALCTTVLALTWLVVTLFGPRG